MDARTRLIGNAVYIGFFAVAGLAFTVYYALTSLDTYIVLASVAGSVFFAVMLVLIGLVFTSALRRGEGGSPAGFTLDPRFGRSIVLATVASTLALSATLFVGSVLAKMSLVAQSIAGLLTAFLAVVLVLGFRSHRRHFPARFGPRS